MVAIYRGIESKINWFSIYKQSQGFKAWIKIDSVQSFL
jgi:hypothetical protein